MTSEKKTVKLGGRAKRMIIGDDLALTKKAIGEAFEIAFSPGDLEILAKIGEDFIEIESEDDIETKIDIETMMEAKVLLARRKNEKTVTLASGEQTRSVVISSDLAETKKVIKETFDIVYDVEILAKKGEELIVIDKVEDIRIMLEAEKLVARHLVPPSLRLKVNGSVEEYSLDRIPGQDSSVVKWAKYEMVSTNFDMPRAVDSFERSVMYFRAANYGLLIKEDDMMREFGRVFLMPFATKCDTSLGDIINTTRTVMETCRLLFGLLQSREFESVLDNVRGIGDAAGRMTQVLANLIADTTNIQDELDKRYSATRAIQREETYDEILIRKNLMREEGRALSEESKEIGREAEAAAGAIRASEEWEKADKALQGSVLDKLFNLFSLESPARRKAKEAEAKSVDAEREATTAREMREQASGKLKENRDDLVKFEKSCDSPYLVKAYGAMKDMKGYLQHVKQFWERITTSITNLQNSSFGDQMKRQAEKRERAFPEGFKIEGVALMARFAALQAICCDGKDKFKDVKEEISCIIYEKVSPQEARERCVEDMKGIPNTLETMNRALKNEDQYQQSLTDMMAKASTEYQLSLGARK